jgi:hypothetical protein
MTDKINIDELPPELVKELDLTNKYSRYNYIIKLLQNGPLDLNHILIGLYREYGDITSRNNLYNIVKILKSQGRIFSVPDKRGFYSLKKPVKND